MATIIDLPVELFEAIIDGLAVDSKEDLANLRATCKYIDALLAPRVLSAICIDLSDLGRARSLIRMASKRSQLHTFARRLNILCLAPGAHPHTAPNILIMAGGSYTYPKPPITDVDVMRATKVVIQHLHKALQHFRKLVDVEWWTHGYDNPVCNTAVMDLIYSQEHLRKVTIDMRRDVVSPFPDLSRLKGLDHLSLRFPREHIRTPSMYLTTAQALRNCPNLRYFNLHIRRHQTGPLTESSNTEEIYRQVAQMDSITELRLEIPSTYWLRELSVMDNLKNLTALEIRSPDGFIWMNNVWTALKRQRIHLKFITFNMDHMVHGFVDYLSSYSGVEELHLSNHDLYWVNPARDFTVLSTSFFEAVVGHAATLRVLRLELNMNGPDATWGPPGVRRLHLLSKLTALTTLEIETCASEREFLETTKLKEYELMYKFLGQAA